VPGLPLPSLFQRNDEDTAPTDKFAPRTLGSTPLFPEVGALHLMLKYLPKSKKYLDNVNNRKEFQVI